MRTSPALSGSSAIWHFKGNNVVEICDRNVRWNNVQILHGTATHTCHTCTYICAHIRTHNGNDWNFQIILTNFTHRADTCLSYRVLHAFCINDAIAFYMYIHITAWLFTCVSKFLVTPGMLFRITTLLFSITRAAGTILWSHIFCYLVCCSSFLLVRHLGKHSYGIIFLRMPLPEVVMLSSKTEV